MEERAALRETIVVTSSRPGEMFGGREQKTGTGAGSS